MGFVIRVAVLAVAVWVATVLIDGIDLGPGTTMTRGVTLLVVALIFGVVNAVIKPVIKTLGCPLYVLTLGLIGLVVNALLFMLVAVSARSLGFPFVVDGFWAAFWGAIVVSVVGAVLQVVIPDRYDDPGNRSYAR